MLEAHLGALSRLTEVQVADEMEAQKQQAIQQELARLQVRLLRHVCCMASPFPLHFVPCLLSLFMLAE